MKKILFKLYKKHFILLLIELIFITVNIYLLTVPSKLLGQIIDMLYNIDANKDMILKTSFLVLGMCVLLIISRVTWKVIDARISRNTVKQLLEC